MYLVSCVGKKLEQPNMAKDIYISTWFKLVKSHIGKNKWMILSAEYGLLSPYRIIEPYDKTLNKMNKKERKIWANKVTNSILKLPFNETEFIIFAGNKYREFLVPTLIENNYKIKVPMLGLGIGQQLKWLKENTVEN